MDLKKHFRALRMWLPLILLGTKPFQAALEEYAGRARRFGKVNCEARQES